MAIFDNPNESNFVKYIVQGSQLIEHDLTGKLSEAEQAQLILVESELRKRNASELLRLLVESNQVGRPLLAVR